MVKILFVDGTLNSTKALKWMPDLLGIDGVAGIHVMGHKNDAVLAEIIVKPRLGHGIAATH